MPFAFLTAAEEREITAELHSESWSEFKNALKNRMSCSMWWKAGKNKRHRERNWMTSKKSTHCAHSMRHQKLIKLHKRPIELRQFTGQTVNLPRMKIDLKKKKEKKNRHQRRKPNNNNEKMLTRNWFWKWRQKMKREKNVKICILLAFHR